MLHLPLFVQQRVVLQLYSRYHKEAAIHSKLIIPVLSYDWGVIESHSLRCLHPGRIKKVYSNSFYFV